MSELRSIKLWSSRFLQFYEELNFIYVFNSAWREMDGSFFFFLPKCINLYNSRLEGIFFFLFLSLGFILLLLFLVFMISYSFLGVYGFHIYFIFFWVLSILLLFVMWVYLIIFSHLRWTLLVCLMMGLHGYVDYSFFFFFFFVPLWF